MQGPLSPAELPQVLRAYGLPPPHGEAPTAITARVLHLPGPDGGLAIKVFGPEHRARAQTEAALLAHLGAAGGGDYRVQQVVRTSADQVLLELDERRVLVTRWEAGVHRSYREIDAEGWAVLGRTMAALHLRLDHVDHAPALPLRSVVDELRARDLDDDRRLLDEHRRRAEASGRPDAALVVRLLTDRTTLLERHATRCQARLLLLEEEDDRPIHNDFNVHNFLFHEHGPPTILDWERAILAPREFELCRCLNHLPLVAPDHAWALVEGYLQRRALRPELIGWAMDAAVTVHALKHWPVELWLERAPGSAERIPSLAEIVRSLLEGAPRLQAFARELEARTRERAS